jgi:uncharacterized protein YjiS (DUF1127 family)
MRLANSISLVPAPSGRRSLGAALLHGLLRWLGAWKDRRHLHALSDHMLSDMGFMRDQIDDILRGSVRRM